MRNSYLAAHVLPRGRHCAAGFLFCVLLLGGEQSAIAAEPVIWDEQPVAAVTIGLDDKEMPVSRRFHVVSVGPEQPAADQTKARSCSSQSLSKAAEAFHKSLLKLSTVLDGAAMNGSAPQMNQALVKLDTDTDTEIDKTITLFNANMASCTGDKTKPPVFQLAIVQRQCDKTTPQCKDPPLIFADAPEALAFTVLNRWAEIRNTGRAFPPNTLVLLPNLTDVSSKAFNLTSGQSGGLHVLDTSVQWPDVKAQLDPHELDQAQEQFEVLVLRARKDKKRLERNTARLVDVPTEIAVRVVDVLDEPQEAVLDLRTVKDAKLLTISDQLARTRIAECVRYRGLREVDKVAECAGYKLTDMVEMQACLAGGRCVPDLNDRAYAGILEMVEVHPNLKDLALAGDLPRVNAFLNFPLDDALKPLGNCARSSSRHAAAECLLNGQLDEDGKRALACFGNEKENDKLGCALGKPLPSEVRLAMNCLQNFKSPREQAVCVAGAKLPPEMAALMRCQDDSGNNVDKLARCTAGKLIGGDVAKALSCVQKYGSNYAEAAVCLAGPQLSPDAALAVQCAQKSSDAMGAAVCYGAKKLPVDVRKPVLCLAESGGDPIGAGVCMVADSLKPEQAIILQCLVSTGGEPTAMAICTGGRLAMKEFFNCVDKKMFEGNCVGTNNEFRKLVEHLTGQKLASNTVVGGYLNFQLDVMKAQVAFAQATLKGTDKLANNIARGTEHAAQKLTQEVGKALDAVATSAERTGKETLKEGEKALKEVSKVPNVVASSAERLSKEMVKEGAKVIKKATPNIVIRVGKRKKPKLKL